MNGGDGAAAVTLLYSEGCPHRASAADAIIRALDHVGLPRTTLTLHPVDTLEEAERVSFHGSPSIHINGSDPFAPSEAAVGLMCRLYRTVDGMTGAPSHAQLIQALRHVLDVGPASSDA